MKPAKILWLVSTRCSRTRRAFSWPSISTRKAGVRTQGHTWRHLASWALPLVLSVRAPAAAGASGYFSKSQSLTRWHGSSVRTSSPRLWNLARILVLIPMIAYFPIRTHYPQEDLATLSRNDVSTPSSSFTVVNSWNSGWIDYPRFLGRP